LLLIGGTTGTTLSALIFPILLNAVGFTTLGIASGSFASWIQSTLGDLVKGSLFATLQSIAMSGVSANIIFSASALGATTASMSAKYLKFICEFIDGVKSDTPQGIIIDRVVEAYERVSKSVSGAATVSAEQLRVVFDKVDSYLHVQENFVSWLNVTKRFMKS
jgi:hypothetical protein